MNKDIFEAIMVVVVVVILLVCGQILSNHIDNLKKEAVQRGFADYNQTTGNWEWKTNVVIVK